MLIIHILVDTSHVEPQDDNVVEDIIILYDQQQIYLHLLLQHLRIFRTFIKTFKLY